MGDQAIAVQSAWTLVECSGVDLPSFRQTSHMELLEIPLKQPQRRT